MDLNLFFRLSVLAILLTLFLISVYFRKRARELGGTIKRPEEGWLVLSLRLVIVLPLFIDLLLNLYYPQLLDWGKFSLPLPARVAGLVLSMLCIPLLWWVFHSIGENVSETVLVKDRHQLITSGPYRWIRHPLYGTSLLLIFSFSLIFEDWIILGYFLAATLAFRLLIIPEEEKQLLDDYGEEYECYQARTGAMFPWLR
jgi:protein-S-isoprenylcysteine O-methyltransferase Ste14